MMPNVPADILGVIKNVTDELVELFPSVPRVHLIPGILGNNDFEADYELNITDIRCVCVCVVVAGFRVF